MRKEFNNIRFYAIAAAFCLVCIVYVVTLFNIQIINANHDVSKYPDGAYFISVDITSVRGEIFDRNGVALVKNKYSDDLVFEYDFIPDSPSEMNSLILEVVNALKATEDTDCLINEYFPFDGCYPALSFSEEFYDEDSPIRTKYMQFLSDNKLPNDTDGNALAEFFIKKYSLSENNKFDMPKYSDEDINAIIMVRYCMKVTGFGPYQSYTIAKDVSDTSVAYIKELGINGVSVRTTSSRQYEFPGYMSHILGNIGKIPSSEWEYYKELGYDIDAYVGISGCEYAFEEYLRSSDGVMTLVYSKDGKLIDSYVEKEPIAGNDVYLTIDANVQIAAEDGLAEAVKYVSEQRGIEECNAGAITAINPKDGSVLAIASYPTYDLNTYFDNYTSLNSDEAKPLLNRATTGTYIPGSTFKVGVAAAMFSENVITQNSYVNCTGKTWSGVRYLNCWINSAQYNYGNHGNLNVTGAITHSCNCFFYENSEKLSINNIYKYFSIFGVGKPTGLEIGGSVGSLAGSPDKAWSTEDTMMASIGQSVTALSPLQLSNYVGTVMNGGTRYQTHLLKEVRTYSSELVYKYETVVLDSLKANGLSLNDTDLDTIQAAMKNMVDSSELIKYNMRNVPVTVGGKTGTAQTGSNIDNALFVATAPHDDPEIVVSVVLEHGYSGSYSSVAAARTFEAFFDGMR